MSLVPNMPFSLETIWFKLNSNNNNFLLYWFSRLHLFRVGFLSFFSVEMMGLYVENLRASINIRRDRRNKNLKIKLPMHILIRSRITRHNHGKSNSMFTVFTFILSSFAFFEEMTLWPNICERLSCNQKSQFMVSRGECIAQHYLHT